ncbi:MAG: S49 family peptidase, partial [Planctomycetes bacterium]|nr:S49 family peptidase [Planctomycetota bacterium]
ENTQRGRYREFMQCDFDTIGTRNIAADVETGLVIHDLMRAIGFERFTIHVNNRKVLNGLLERIELADRSTAVLRALDKLAKIGPDKVAAAAERIFARPTTITGSIGVIMSNYNFAEAAKKLGIDQVVVKSDRTPYKDILSPFRAMQPEEHALLQRIVEELYDRFVDVVDAGRDELDRDGVLAVATGAIYSATDARDKHLVDEIGGQDDVLRWFENALDTEVALVGQRRRVGLADLLFGSRATPPTLESAAGRLLTGLSGPRFLYYWEGGR